MLSDNIHAYLVFFLVLTIAGNYTGNLMNCQVQSYLKSNRMIQHFSAFMTLLFFIVISNQTTLRFQEALSHSISLYIVFMLISKCEFKCFMIVMGIFMVSAILRKYMNEATKLRSQKKCGHNLRNFPLERRWA